MLIHPTPFTLLLSTIFIFSAVFFPYESTAQFGQPTNDISLQINPEIPAPEEQVSASLSAFGIDLSSATITWFIGGNQVAAGRGETSVSFTAPTFGDSTTVRAVINITGAGTISKTRTITPTEVDVLWEAPDAYTPPFYKGKALPASQGVIRVVAIPHLVSRGGGVVSAENARYTWEKNFRKRDFNNQSGYGADTVVYRKSLLEDTDRITVNVSAQNGQLTGEGTVIIPAFTPEVLFYQDHPLYGIQYEHAFKNRFAFQTQESTIVAEPYFFSINTPDDLSYQWRSGSTDIPTDQEDRANELTMRSEGGSGQVNFSLSATHPDYILQLIQTTFNVIVGEEAGSGQNDPFSL